jgi:hypothetical protein
MQYAGLVICAYNFPAWTTKTTKQVSQLSSYTVAMLTEAATAYQRPLFTELLPSNGWPYIFLISDRCLALVVYRIPLYYNIS